MTAEIFLQRRQQIYVGGMLVGIVLAFAIFLSVVIHFKANNHSMGYGAIAVLVGYVAPIVLANIWRKRFTGEHPEMQFIWDWYAAGGDVKDYPTDEKDQAEVEGAIYWMLFDRARAADAAMQIRDRIKAAKLFSPSAISEYNRALTDLSARAESLNQRYLYLWDLVVVKMGRFPEDTNPREFRELNREKIYE
jgi:hypothetical protein